MCCVLMVQLFNNAYLHYITKLVAEISTILGKTDKAAQYHAAADKLAQAVTKTFANAATGVYLDTLQTHSAMPLASGLVPSSLANKTLASLAHQIVVVDKGHLDTGLTGTYFMTKMLMEAGRNDLVFTYANQVRTPPTLRTIICARAMSASDTSIPARRQPFQATGTF